MHCVPDALHCAARASRASCAACFGFGATAVLCWNIRRGPRDGPPAHAFHGHRTKNLRFACCLRARSSYASRINATLSHCQELPLSASILLRRQSPPGQQRNGSIPDTEPRWCASGTLYRMLLNICVFADTVLETIENSCVFAEAVPETVRITCIFADTVGKEYWS